MKKKMIWGALFFVLIALTGCGKKVEMRDYAELNISGPNGKGMAYLDFDMDRFIADLPMKESESQLLDYAMIYDSADYRLDKEDNLKNGDTVTVEFTIADKYKKVKTSPLKVKVEGLKDPVKLSQKAIVENLDFEFTGLSGSGNMNYHLKNKEYPFSDLTVVVENNGELKNGGKAKIKADLAESYADRDEYYVLEDEQFEIEVAGLTEIPEDISVAKNLDVFQKVMKETIEGKFGSSREKIEIVNFYYRAEAPNEPSITSGTTWGNPHSKFGEIAALVKRTIVSGYDEGSVNYYMFISGENSLEEGRLNLKRAENLSRHDFKTSFKFDTVQTIVKEDKYKVIEDKKE